MRCNSKAPLRSEKASASGQALKIIGNTAISAPVQTANPANYGGNVSEIGIGLNQLLSIFPGEHSDRIGIELLYPVQQNLNGPQMKSGLTFQIGYQKSLP